MDKEQIKEQAKKIMDEFIAALDSVPELKQEFGAVRDDSIRKDMDNKYPKGSFKEKMFENAPKVDDEQIVAEKKKW